MIEAILVAVITALIPAVVNLITSGKVMRRSRLESAKSHILTLITEDRVRMLSKQDPINYQHIMYEFDRYRRYGGNSYMCDKVKEYKKLCRDWAKETL